MIWIELAILLACILVGARLGGIALGAVAGLGLVVFVFFYRPPSRRSPGSRHWHDHRGDNRAGDHAGGWGA